MILFAHRNGETEMPTEVGMYLFLGTRYGYPMSAVVEVILFHAVFYVMDGIPVGENVYQGRWWGPIAAQQETNQ